MSRRYPPAGGKWEAPDRDAYKMMCCDCGLIHSVRFRLVKTPSGGRQIQWFVERDNRATALARRSGGKKGHGILAYPGGETYMLIYLGKRRTKKSGKAARHDRVRGAMNVYQNRS